MSTRYCKFLNDKGYECGMDVIPGSDWCDKHGTLAVKSALPTPPSFPAASGDDDKPVLTSDDEFRLMINNIKICRKKYNNDIYDYNLEMLNIDVVFEIAKRIQAGKAKTYRGSWKKRGWIVSVFGNISRKFDRLESIFTDASKALEFENSSKPSLSEESVLDTFLDLGVYSMLAVTKIMMEKPEIFDDYLKRNGLIPLEKRNG